MSNMKFLDTVENFLETDKKIIGFLCPCNHPEQIKDEDAM